MPVVATPFLFADETAALEVVVPDVTHVEGVPSFGRKQTARVNQGQHTVLRWQIRDRMTGRVIDLTSVADGDGMTSSASSASGSSSPSVIVQRVEFRACEATYTNTTLSWAADAAVVDAPNGVVQVTLPADLTDLAGVFDVEFGLFDASGSAGKMVYSVQGGLWVNRGQFGTGPSRYSVPSLDDLKTQLVDSGPEDNYLTAVVEFDVSQVAAATLLAVRRFNSRPPAISGLARNTTNFPDSAQLVDGILAELYLMAANHYRRNALPYQAAGVSVDDKNKDAQYERIGTGLLQKFEAWAGVVKKAANAAAWNGTGTGAMATQLSPYSYPGGVR